MWAFIGGIVLFSWGYHMGKQDEKEKRERKTRKSNRIAYQPNQSDYPNYNRPKDEVDHDQNKYYVPPSTVPSAPPSYDHSKLDHTTEINSKQVPFDKYNPSYA